MGVRLDISRDPTEMMFSCSCRVADRDTIGCTLMLDSCLRWCPVFPSLNSHYHLRLSRVCLPLIYTLFSEDCGYIFLFHAKMCTVVI